MITVFDRTFTFAAPLNLPRANPCFVTGNVPLAAEVVAGLPTLEKVVTCNNAVSSLPVVC